jgi:FlaA1/EpsC-like NDP-sugar epimerase
LLRLIIATIEEMNSAPKHVFPSLSASFSPESLPIPTHLIRQKRVLITGAGGSVGSALAQALVAHGPAQVLLLEASEQALYRIDRELAAPHKPILADICDASALEEAFELHQPEIVFHAAAFKHVPLMELHPFACLQNNAVGTFTLAQAAVRHRVQQMVLVSTDKAVDPISIMGASKRIAELTALALRTAKTKMKAVRLGNIYASQGSAVPLFAEQIAQRKSVTISHADATRYFLTIEQAAALLLFALSEEFSSAVLVPDLKNPLRVEEIARALIQQSGTTSKIVYTGLRPGEKLHEQLLSKNESYLCDARGPLNVIQSGGILAAEARVAINELQQTIHDRDLSRMLRTVTRLIPSYRPSEVLLARQAFAECRG